MIFQEPEYRERAETLVKQVKILLKKGKLEMAI